MTWYYHWINIFDSSTYQQNAVSSITIPLSATLSSIYDTGDRKQINAGQCVAENPNVSTTCLFMPLFFVDWQTEW